MRRLAITDELRSNVIKALKVYLAHIRKHKNFIAIKNAIDSLNYYSEDLINFLDEHKKR